MTNSVKRSIGVSYFTNATTVTVLLLDLVFAQLVSSRRVLSVCEEVYLLLSSAALISRLLLKSATISLTGFMGYTEATSVCCRLISRITAIRINEESCNPSLADICRANSLISVGTRTDNAVVRLLVALLMYLPSVLDGKPIPLSQSFNVTET